MQTHKYIHIRIYISMITIRHSYKFHSNSRTPRLAFNIYRIQKLYLLINQIQC